MKNFQLITLIVFGFLSIGGLIAFATYKGGKDSDALVPITVWGSFSGDDIAMLSKTLRDTHKIDPKIQYREIPEAQFDQKLLEAIASGESPDAIILPLELLYRYQDKIIPISFESFSEREFKNTYIEAAEIFLGEGEIKGLPFSIDPLVMYWNRDIFNTAGIPAVPKYWSEFITIAPTLTRKDTFSNVTKSAVALGEYRNVTNAKGILSALLLQSGNPVTFKNENRSALLSAGGANAVSFYTEFANPVKTVYSWNRSLPASKTRFIAGDLAMYFGYASEFADIRQKNPNLNFDVATFPQTGEEAVKRTYGRMWGIAILRYSPNAANAYKTFRVLTGPESIAAWSTQKLLPPVRRDLLAAKPSDASLAVFYDSALFARSFIDPNPASTDRIFMNLIETITSGQASVSDALNRANGEVDKLFAE